MAGRIKRVFVWALAVSVAVMVCGPALGKGGGRGGGGGGGGGNSNGNNGGNGNSSNNNSGQGQQSAVTAARNDVTTAATELTTLTKQKLSEFIATPDMVTAVKEMQDAQAALDAAQKVALDHLSTTAAFAAASAKKDKASADLDALRNSGTASPDDLTAKATEKMNDATIVAKMMADAYKSDAGCQAAQTRLNAANAAIAKLKANFVASLNSDPTYSAAQQKLYDARTKLAKLTGTPLPSTQPSAAGSST